MATGQDGYPRAGRGRMHQDPIRENAARVARDDQVIGVQVGILEADRDKEVLIRVTTNWAPAK